MKRSLLFVAVAITGGLFLASCGSKASLSSSSTEIDSVSYAIGLNMGKSLQNAKINDLNVELMVAAMKEGMSTDSTIKLAMSPEQASQFIQSYLQRKELKKFEEKNKAAGEKFLEENKAKADVTTTPSGLQYKISTLGTGAKPRPFDTVEVFYKGTLLNGTIFDTNEGGKPVKFRLDEVIKGWTEGIQQVPAGSKVTLYIPQNLGYGVNAPSPYGPIEPYMALIFDVELLKVIPGAETPAPATAPTK